MRTRLLEALAAAPALTAIIAPAGWGKSALLESAATSDLRVVLVALGSTEGHPSLLVDAFAQGLKRAYPGTAVGAVRAVAALRTDEAPERVLERTREALGVTTTTVAFDEVERLPRGPVFEILRRIIRARPAGFRFVFTSRQPLPPELALAPNGELAVADGAIGVRELALSSDEIDRLLGGAERGLARSVALETGGWPALVSARLRVARSGAGVEAGLAAMAPVVDEAIAHLKSEARYVLQLAAIVGSFEQGLMQSMVSGAVPGSAEARRRLMRLEPSVVANALSELVSARLVVAQGTSHQCLVGLRRILSQRFMQQDRAGWLEANRRAAELRLDAVADGDVSVDLVDLFAACGERARLLEILGKNGARLELELAAGGESDRLLAWVEALEAGTTPFWCDVLAGLAWARQGDAERARDRLDKAREKLATERFEKRDATHWRWQVRIAEAQAIAARSKADFNDARSWLLRGIDQVEELQKRGLTGGDAEEAKALQVRMAMALADLSRASTGWDKTREAALHALVLVTGATDEARRDELRRMLIAGAFAAGDVATIDVESRGYGQDSGWAASSGARLGRVARVGHQLLIDGKVGEAMSALRELAGDEPLAALLLARISELGPEREALLGAAARAEDPWVALEAELRRGQADSGLEGYSAAVVAETQAAHPGRALELARDAYRRIGARWDETRLWLMLGAAAARRVDDGDGEVDAVVRPIDGAVEASLAAGFAIPWSIAGRGESDPERRVRTLLLAGLRQGQDKTKAVCRAELERLGVDTRAVVATPERPAKFGAARRQIAAGGSPFIQVSRSGTQGISALDYQAVVSSKAASAFIVCVPDQLVLNFGRQVSLGQKRVMMPLLLHLLRNSEDSFSMLELAREIWESPELTPTVQTKVKVAVSRLRALLGKSRNYIITTRKMEANESVVAYQTAPQLQFQIIEAAPRD